MPPLAAGLGLALACGLLLGLAPAIQLIRESQSSAMARSRRRRFQHLVSPGYFETLRMALGARPAQILAEFLKHGVLAGAAGLLVGLAASVYAQRWFTGMLFEIKPFDACC